MPYQHKKTRLDIGRHKLETMYEEHATTLNQLDLLMQAIRAARTSRDMALPRYRDLLGTLLGDLEEIVVDHFRFEESHVFPLLREAGRQDLADSLTQEHVAIRTASIPVLARLHSALATNPSEKEWTEFGRLATTLIEMKRAHMQREESEMVPVLLKIEAEGRTASIP